MLCSSLPAWQQLDEQTGDDGGDGEGDGGGDEEGEGSC